MKIRSINKLLWTILLLVTPLVAMSGVAYGADTIKRIDAAPFIENDRIYDTVRPIAETFGVYVDWDQERQTVRMTRGVRQVVMEVGSHVLTVITPNGTEAFSLEVVPVLRDNRVFLPTRSWAEAFGLTVTWHEGDGSVTISEGTKTLTFAPGNFELSLMGGHFLKLYDQDEKLSFYYPDHGDAAITWEGYAEVLLKIEEDDYVIVAMNASAGHNDPINYTKEEFVAQIYKNAEATNGNVKQLDDTYYGVPAYRITRLVEGIPQAGVIFLRDGYLCGLTIEAKLVQSQDEVQDGTQYSVNTREISRNLISQDSTEIEEGIYHKELVVVNTILDEIMASLIVK